MHYKSWVPHLYARLYARSRDVAEDANQRIPMRDTGDPDTPNYIKHFRD
jgi:hypothetical protein